MRISKGLGGYTELSSLTGGISAPPEGAIVHYWSSESPGDPGVMGEVCQRCGCPIVRGDIYTPYPKLATCPPPLPVPPVALPLTILAWMR